MQPPSGRHLPRLPLPQGGVARSAATSRGGSSPPCKTAVTPSAALRAAPPPLYEGGLRVKWLVGVGFISLLPLLGVEDVVGCARWLNSGWVVYAARGEGEPAGVKGSCLVSIHQMAVVRRRAVSMRAILGPR